MLAINNKFFSIYLTLGVVRLHSLWYYGGIT
jgi:hypothetical protein